MKINLPIFVVALAVSVPCVRAGTFTNLAIVSNCCQPRWVAELRLEANQKAKVVNVSPSVVSPSFEFVQQFEPTPGNTIRITSTGSFTNLVFYGPVTIEFAAIATLTENGTAGVATLEVLPASDSGTVPLTSIPSTAVAIPADSGGPVTIALESSVDMITWNAALPGTYGTSTTNRFFRVRAIRN